MLGEQESALATEHVKVALKKYFQRPPSLPGREETQRVCLRDCHYGNQESCPFSSKAAREAEDAELQPLINKIVKRNNLITIQI